MENEIVNCPFQKGDVLKSTDKHIENSSWNGQFCFVTAVHKGGFDYSYPLPVPFIHRDASYITGGTAYPASYDIWKESSHIECIRGLAALFDLAFNYNPGGGAFSHHGFPDCQITTYDDEYDLNKLIEYLKKYGDAINISNIDQYAANS